MRLIELRLWSTTEDLESLECFKSCHSIADLEEALEACYETEEDAADAAAEEREDARDEGLPAESRAVALRVTVERPGRYGPNDFEL